MRIIGKRGQSKLFYLITRVDSPNLSKPIFIRFYVDTGASITCLSDTDALKFKLDYWTLPKARKRVSGVGGIVRLRILKKCEIDFITEDGYHVEKLDRIHIFDRGDINKAIFTPQISLLGVDVLRKFKLTFKKNSIFLDK